MQTAQATPIAPITVSQTPLPNLPIPTTYPPFSGSDPFWIIVAVAILVRAILGQNNTSNHHHPKGD